VHHTRSALAGGSRIHGGATAGGGESRSLQWHDQRNQPHCSRAFRRRRRRRLQCTQRCRPTGSGLERRFLWRRSPRRIHLRPRGGSFQIRLCDICARPARSKAMRCPASRYVEISLHTCYRRSRLAYSAPNFRHQSRMASCETSIPRLSITLWISRKLRPTRK
jgi:hypothetical protein